jgi:Ni/Co efflux regulator RcnB
VGGPVRSLFEAERRGRGVVPEAARQESGPTFASVKHRAIDAQLTWTENRVGLRLWFAAGVIAAMAVAGMLNAQQPTPEADRGRPAFSAHDRYNLNDWYREHRDYPPRGFRRQDRLPAKLQSQLAVGAVLAKDLRRRIVPMPDLAIDLLSPPPPECRYVALGGNIVLIEKKTWMVEDFVHFDLNP